MERFSDETVVGIFHSRFRSGLIRIDLRDSQLVEGFLSKFLPDVIIHCAARPTVDWCEHHPEEAHALNVDATVFLADACARSGTKLVFLSTDYVFNGVGGPYHEEAGPNPINVYGRLKLEAELAIQERLSRYLIVRTTNVYGFDLESKNFLMGILPRLARQTQVCVAVDQIGNPTYVHDLCSVVRRLVDSDANGIFHVVGPDLMNRVEWAQAAAEAFDLNPKLVVGATTEELGQPAPRPTSSGLISNRLDLVVREPLLGLKQGLSLMIRKWGGDPPIASW